LTDLFEHSFFLTHVCPFFEAFGIQLFSSDEYASKIMSDAESETLSSIIAAHLSTIGKGDYFGLLAYVEMNSINERKLQEIRGSVLSQHNCATCLGFGPRFLHSTGQAYKGGGTNGVFLQITSDDAEDIPVPGQLYSFGVVKAAQARGDFQVLLDRGRRALRIHIGADVEAELKKINEMLIRS
jgi:transaldolase/glucose-6-phosphate isomerase